MSCICVVTSWISTNSTVAKIWVVVVFCAAHTPFEVCWFIAHGAAYAEKIVQSRRKAAFFNAAFFVAQEFWVGSAEVSAGVFL